MNIFAKITTIQSLKKVDFYSILKEGEDANMFLEFVNRISTDEKLAGDLDLIRVWLKWIGDKHGAKEQYFRLEKAANALPPPAKYLEFESSLRLYCMRVNENAVVLFSGALKTARTAQECPNVKPYFAEANKITSQIDRAIVDRSIKIDSVTGRLIIDDDFTIEL